jgi:hypothetical protein
MPQRPDAATLALYIYADSDVLELFAGFGTSFLFEDLENEAMRATAFERALRIGRAIVEGGLQETVIAEGSKTLVVQGSVHTSLGEERSQHVFGKVPAGAARQTYDYRPYCQE